MLICMVVFLLSYVLSFLFYSLLYHYDPVSIVSFLVRYFSFVDNLFKRVRIVSAKKRVVWVPSHLKFSVSCETENLR